MDSAAAFWCSDPACSRRHVWSWNRRAPYVAGTPVFDPQRASPRGVRRGPEARSVLAPCSHVRFLNWFPRPAPLEDVSCRLHYSSSTFKGACSWLRLSRIKEMRLLHGSPCSLNVPALRAPRSFTFDMTAVNVAHSLRGRRVGFIIRPWLRE